MTPQFGPSAVAARGVEGRRGGGAIGNTSFLQRPRSFAGGESPNIAHFHVWTEPSSDDVDWQHHSPRCSHRFIFTQFACVWTLKNSILPKDSDPKRRAGTGESKQLRWPHF